ncbi:hypothetical protein [Pseudomarimonas arenosa]|uniref:Lipoprotein n=1 Tax=Pseudomarimonas arenosa TaxID=2774145 RepID=A0AAW3ZI79_9GAMM|nr:hypothetical protein [Pseudomarimonas arenosa]MBD8525125.1 hypothetical protein [Pseudomarimonas arenosa]
MKQGVLAALGLVVLLAACNKKPELVAFSPPGGEFTAQMPSNPWREYKEEQTEFGPVEIVAYTSSFDEVQYRVGVEKLPDPLSKQFGPAGSERAFDLGRDGMLAQVQARLTEERGKSSKRWRSREVLAALPDGRHKLIGRVFWNPPFLIYARAVLPADASYNQDLYAVRFLDSLQIPLRH